MRLGTTIVLSTSAAVRNRRASCKGPLGSSKIVLIALLFCISAAVNSPAQDEVASNTTFTTLMSFNGTDGVYPEHSSLIQGFDGNYYGTVFNGGTATLCGVYGCGTVFKITPSGTLTTLHTFKGSDGAYPYGTLVQGTDGTLYGTTHGTVNGDPCTGVTGGCGTFYKITTGGTLTTLLTFTGTNGNGPNGLIMGTDGYLYGTTTYGGSHNGGTVFKMTTAGKLTTLYSFCSSTGCTQSSYPLAGLAQGSDGNFYGTSGGTFSSGCPLSCGTIFKITSSGTLTTLHTFKGSDGAIPHGVVQGTDGNFYGLTVDGGSSTICTSGCGTMFKVTTGGTLTTLHSFCLVKNCTDGSYPEDGLMQATDGDFYGTTSYGGSNKDGTIFKITSGGTLTTVHTFNWTDGAHPSGGIMQATNGEFYGSALGGGFYGNGDIFSISEGLAAFLEANPTSGKVASKVTVLGTGLTGASSVTFNGKAATYTVVSASEITATVPTGATSGTLEVQTSGGLYKSNVAFTVTK